MERARSIVSWLLVPATVGALLWFGQPWWVILILGVAAVWLSIKIQPEKDPAFPIVPLVVMLACGAVLLPLAVRKENRQWQTR